ncbi:MAG: histidine kinase [Burkholderiaceae bacterium]
MPTDPSTPAASFWKRLRTGSVQLFHEYANWLVGISWKRFFLLAVLLMMSASILQNLPPFRWTLSEVSEDLPRHREPPPPAAPPGPETEPPDARSGGSDSDNVVISIDKHGVRISPRRPAVAASAAAAASGASAAADTDTRRIEIALPGATGEVVREALESARDAISEVAREARQEAEQARGEADQAARETGDAAAETEREGRQYKRTRVVHVGDFLTDLAFFFIVASAIVKITYKGRVQAEFKAAAATETAESEQLKRQVVEARMAAMQAQVEPHFLFNTLASIDHLIETDPARASQMQKNLIALLRASMPTMRENHPAAHNLGREMAVIRPYLEILKVRMEDRLQTEIDVPDGLLSADFPPMMIQSLVENAIKHGLEPKPEGGLLSVRAQVTHGKIAVTVADTGMGFGKASTTGTGIGLNNIRERLQLLYAGKASMTVSDNPPGGTRVTLTVPYQAHSPEGATA